ncbi:MAG: DUF6084 family protein [Pyrinomonadaceae bacterium]
MPDLNFAVERAEAVPYAAAPLLNLKVRVTTADPDEVIQSVMLRCQIRIETTRRQYSPAEQAKMFELFGEPARWGQTLKTLLWTHTSMVITPFTGSTAIEMPVPCTFDFNVATTKYFDGVEMGDIPLCLLFSGTVFYHDGDGLLQMAQISWEKEASYRLPISVWKQMMEMYYPNCAWLNIRKDVFDKLQEYKMQRGLTSWERALEGLLPSEAEKGNTAGGIN